ncbi:hypothetical protein [Caldovatus aquaticus]|uniref:Uncharacterized protein n=1 Tax=Caldovatus aquaticus TaxID=2865671 RepID=A0ABS7EY68_9PROT|nr:hypothetical protein [Caldovatus aquaticus]MBW8268290.1 hypothetical protein [Caldovatus aquaticus]
MHPFPWRFPFVHETADPPAGGGGGGEPAAAPEAAAGPHSDRGGDPNGTRAPAAPDWLHAAPERPDWLPETFYDPERKGIRVDALANSYRELQGRFSQKNETLKAEVLKELRAGVPETPEGYSFEIPKELVPEGFEVQQPPADDPLLGEARKVLHELGAKPEQWRRLIGAFVRWQVAQAPDLEAERQKIGEGAEERIAAVDMWLARQLPEEQYRALMGAATSAPFVLAMESLMRKATGGAAGGLPAGLPGGGEGQMTGEKARELMRHPDYNHPEKGEPMRRAVYEFLKAGGQIPRTLHRPSI